MLILLLGLTPVHLYSRLLESNMLHWLSQPAPGLPHAVSRQVQLNAFHTSASTTEPSDALPSM